MKKNICALVLAAGFSKRYGSDKRFSGEEALILKTLKNIIKTFDSIYLVHRNSDEKLLNLLKDLPLKLIKAPVEDICLGTSISVGIEYIKNTQIKYDACAIFLADMPFIKEETINKIKSLQKNNEIIRPSFNEKAGHPVVFSNSFFKELILIKKHEGANVIIKNNLKSLALIEVADSGVLEDIDYPESI
ncbi:MAG: nucleotidyltransferase family protein [Campylobacteraceae bacterium]|nr:nucleotidyltransferase family protein [Campylobacteraceae bacterium]